MIRTETQQDRSKIATLIARTYLSEGASIIEKVGYLRQLNSYNNHVSFVEENEEGILCFALFTPVKAGEGEGVFLAPLAFDDRAAALNLTDFLEEAFVRVRAQGYRYIFVQGVLGDLKNFGFAYAEDVGFTYKTKDILVKDLEIGVSLSGELVLPQVLEDD